MGPIEVLFTVIVIILALIGLARGYRRELGSTLIILTAIFVLSFFEEEIIKTFGTVSAALLADSYQTEIRNLLYMLFFQVLFVVIVFAGYAGSRTLEFPGKPAPPPLGPLLDLALGTLNGYLIAGTLWYYLDHFGYPVQSFGWIRLPLTSTGQALVGLLPQQIFESPTYWMLPVAVLLFLRVRG